MIGVIGVVLSKDPLVYYLQRRNSISYSFNEKKIHLVEGYLERRKFVEENYPQFLNIVDNILADLIINLYIETIKTRKVLKYGDFRNTLIITGENLLKLFDRNTDIQVKEKLQKFIDSPNKYILKKVKEKIL